MTAPVKTTVSSDTTSAPVVAGWIMILLGGALTGFAFIYNVGVETGASSYGVPEQVVNFHRAGFRNMLLAIGVGSFISGWIALGAGLIVDAIKSR